MTSRRTGILTALVLTAALFLSMPGLWRTLLQSNPDRAHESLRPKQTRTLAVWLLPGQGEDRKLIARAASAFEKAQPGVRIFLRVVSAEEFTAPDAVLPDVALYETGGLNLPEKLFVPLAGEDESSGMFAGVSYAMPLWLSPNVLSLPASWLEGVSVPKPKAESLLAASTPEPAAEAQSALPPDQLPWSCLVQPGSLSPPEGVALCQLLCMCPYALRQALSSAVRSPAHADHARVQTLKSHLSAVQNGEALIGCVLSPAVSDRVRYVSLCRESPEALAFVQFLRTEMAEEALASSLIPIAEQPLSHSNPLTRQTLALFQQSHTLPNAFAHTREELLSLCSDAFARCADPVETLLRLR